MDRMKKIGPSRALRVWTRAIFLAAWPCLGTAAQAPCSPGAVVDSVAPSGAAEQAGFREGDLILAADGKAIPGPFQFEMAERTHASASQVLEGERAGREASWHLDGPPWGLSVRPAFSPSDLDSCKRGKELLDAGKGEEASAAWTSLAAALESRGEADPAAWLLLKASEAQVRQKKTSDALESLKKATAVAREGGSREARFLCGDRLGVALKDRSLLQEAEAAFKEERAEAEAGWGKESLPYALALTRLATVAWARRDLRPAREGHEEALRIRERLAPGSLEAAESYTGLGQTAFSGGRLEEADRFFSSALEIQARLAPGSLEEARSLSGLGVVSRNQGDLKAAQEYAQRALAVQENLAPASLAVANSLTTLGLVAHERGDLEKAEACHRRALEIREAKSPGGAAVAGSLNNLAGVAESRGDLDLAIHCYRKAVALMEKLEPESLDLASCYSNLGNSLSARGDARGALDAYKKTQAIEGKVAPDSIQYVGNFVNFGAEARRAGDLATAERELKEAVAGYERLAPQTLAHADALYYLSEVYADKRERKSQEACLLKAVDIAAGLAPESLRAAQCFRDLARLCLAEGRKDSALERYGRAMDSLEGQSGMLGGSFESRCAFREATYETYGEAIGLLLALGREEEAFALLERSRARVLLEMLSERDLDLGEEVPRSVALARGRLLREQERLQEEIAEGRTEPDAKDTEATRARLAEIRSRLASMRAEIRKSSPRYAAYRDPVPMTLGQARAALERDTLLLEYSVGRDRCTLFVLSGGPGELQTFAIKAGAEELDRRARSFRESVNDFKGARGAGPLRAQASALFHLLVGPAERAISKAARLIVVPDGPLYDLPMGALVNGEGRYLAEILPLRIAPSATLALSGGQGRRGAATASLVAFADPAVPGRSDRPGAAGSSAHLALPSSRLEAASVSALFGDHAAAFCGADATKARALSEVPKAGYVHFACHGTFKADFPLSSGLALAPPPGENKEDYLQAWEVFERLRSRAELVTLSSCDSGRGKSYQGEGLLGLVQAFRYAGARSVVASLWQIGDESTAVFMERFYSYLIAGQTKDEALRRAQVDFIRAGSSPAAPGRSVIPAYASSPYFWAAFQLYGEYR
jgi:CHAT domain-containing protein/Tfp pilus assembly protein PilF